MSTKMRPPRKKALSWALALFDAGKSRAEMDTEVDANPSEAEPNAYAVRYLWTKGRQWVTEQLAAGKVYDDIAALAEKDEAAELKAVRLACLEEIKAEGHKVPQRTGSLRPASAGQEHHSPLASQVLLGDSPTESELLGQL